MLEGESDEFHTGKVSPLPKASFCSFCSSNTRLNLFNMNKEKKVPIAM